MTYKSDLPPMDFDAFHKAVALGDSRTAYNLVAEHTEARTEERIIKLIEGDEGQKIMCLECSDELIALIKGENNAD